MNREHDWSQRKQVNVVQKALDGAPLPGWMVENGDIRSGFSSTRNLIPRVQQFFRFRFPTKILALSNRFAALARIVSFCFITSFKVFSNSAASNSVSKPC